MAVIKRKPVKKVTKKTNRKTTKKVGGKLINDVTKYSKEIQKYIAKHPDQAATVLEQAKQYAGIQPEPVYVPPPPVVKPWYHIW